MSAGMGRDGTAIIVRDKVVAEKGAGDAGSEWGIGGHDSNRYYKAALTEEVKQAAMRKTSLSSKFLELWQLLVMARVMGPGWGGKHVCIQVDNRALVPMFKKGRAKKPQENDMVREICILQVAQGWTWQLQWIQRELNEAADALSKDDMPRFWSNTSGARTAITVAAADLELPKNTRVHGFRVPPTVTEGA